MAQRQYVEGIEAGSGTASRVVIALAVVLVAAIVALFLLLGGTNRFMSGPAASAPSAPSTTNVNVPAPAPAPAPQINIPRDIDVTINQPSPTQ